MSDAKKCLLNAAAKLFSKQGLEKTSTRDLAKESNSNISLISYHFGGKEGLYKEVLREFALEVQSSTSVRFDKYEKQELTKESFIEEMNHIVNTMISMRMKHPEICTILAREKIEGLPLSKDIHEEIFYPLANKFFSLFKNAQDRKIVREELNPALFFALLSEGIFGFFQILSCETQFKKDYSKLLENPELLKKQILDVYLQGALA